MEEHRLGKMPVPFPRLSFAHGAYELYAGDKAQNG